jgi:integrase
VSANKCRKALDLRRCVAGLLGRCIECSAEYIAETVDRRRRQALAAFADEARPAGLAHQLGDRKVAQDFVEIGEALDIPGGEALGPHQITLARLGEGYALRAAKDSPAGSHLAWSRWSTEGRRVRFLTAEQADHLIECYAEHVRPIIRLFRYQGARTQEALQLQWPHVDFPRATLFFERTKNGEPRTVPMHPAVAQELEAIWLKRGKPDLGHVFLNRLGKPYADTRDRLWPGGNPLAKAHATAIARMAKRRTPLRPNGGEDFRIHDWRHHWASHCVMSGMDLLTLKRLGGWTPLPANARKWRGSVAFVVGAAGIEPATPTMSR